MFTTLAVDLAGWGGVSLLLLAYVLVSTRCLGGDSTLFQALNLAGSALLIVNSLYYGAYPSVGVNVAWIGVAFHTLVRRRAGAHRTL